MRTALTSLLLALALATAGVSRPADAAPNEFVSLEQITQWTFTYLDNPEPWRLTSAVSDMYALGLFDDEKRTGYFVGFIAGVLNRNPDRAARLIEELLALPAKEQAVIIRALAYSELPEWPALMVKYAPQMPERRYMIDEFLSGARAPLMYAPLETETVVFTLWGFYVATGDPRPARRVISALALADGGEPAAFSWERVGDAFGWSDEEDQKTLVDRAVVGSVAKWTLVSYAEYHRGLIDLYRAEAPEQPEVIRVQLEDVIAAAERFEAERVRQEEAAKIEELKQRYARTGSYGSRAAYAGSVGIATACVIAGAVGQAAIAIPCVITGALFSGGMQIFEW